MEILIRNETEYDYRQVEEITREAFWNLYVPGCDEHYLVHSMRDHADFIRELDFVAECDGKIVGNIMYTRSWLIDEVGQELEIMSFGPVCVLPEYQRKGIGSTLIDQTKKIAIKNGAKAIVIYGDPNNYCKHGFKSSKDYNISNMEGRFPYAMLALELEAGALAGHAWRCRQSAAYEFNKEDVDEFDKGFAKKEKGYRYTQEIFSIAIRSTVN